MFRAIWNHLDPRRSFNIFILEGLEGFSGISSWHSFLALFSDSLP